MTKKVLFLHEGTFPGGFAMSNRLRLYMKMLNGSDLTTRIVIPRRNVTSQELEYENALINFLWLNPISKNIFLRKFSYLIQDFKWVKYIIQNRNQIDVVFISAMSIWPMFLITLTSNLFKKKIICELNEYPFSSQGGNFIDDLEFYKVFRRRFMEGFILKRIKSVISISGELSSYIKKINSNIEIFEIPILCDSDYFKLVNSEKSMVNENQNYIVHASHLSEYKDGFISVLKAIGTFNLSLSEKEKIHIYITSNHIPPLLFEPMNQVIQSFNLNEYIHFIGYQNDADLFNLYSNATFLIINKPNNLQNKYNFPTKLSEYLYYSKVLIVSLNTAMAKYLINNRNCVVFKNNDSDDLLEKIKYVFSNKLNQDYLKMEAVNTVENNFDYKVHQINFQNAFLN